MRRGYFCNLTSAIRNWVNRAQPTHIMK
jgi:hypothetical protein